MIKSLILSYYLLNLSFYLPPCVFGCVCFVHILTPGQDKRSAKATKCVFLGYSRLQRGYRCYSPDTNRYFISADVTFFEDSSSFSSTVRPSAEEMDALYSNDTWELVALPPCKSPIGCRWVYTVKVGPDGQIDRLKARLVVKGYT